MDENYLHMRLCKNIVMFNTDYSVTLNSNDFSCGCIYITRVMPIKIGWKVSPFIIRGFSLWHAILYRLVSGHPFLLTADFKRWEYFMKCDGMLDVHTLYATHGWKGRSSKSLKDSLPSLPDGLQLIQVPPCFCISYIIRTDAVPYHIQTVQETLDNAHA
jgi:hypothetical protein